jgi:hypothetical protein
MYRNIVLKGGQCPTCQSTNYRPVRPTRGLMGVGVCLSCNRDHTFINEFFGILLAAQSSGDKNYAVRERL